MASCWPPSVATDSAAGGVRHQADGELSGHPGCGRVREQGIGIGPVAHRDRTAALKGKTRLFFLPREHVGRRRPVAIDRVAERRERTDAGIGVDHDASGLIEESTAEAVEVLEEHRDKSFVPGARPDEPKRQAVVPLCARHGGRELVEGRRGGVEQIGPPIEHADVHEPRQGKERSLPPISRDRGGEEFVRRRMEAVKRQNPSGRRELRCRDGIELQDVRLRGVRIQPLDVQLVLLVGGIGNRLNFNLQVGMLRLERGELMPQHLAFTTDGAAGEHERPGGCLLRTGQLDQKHAEHDTSTEGRGVYLVELETSHKPGHRDHTGILS